MDLPKKRRTSSIPKPQNTATGSLRRSSRKSIVADDHPPKNQIFKKKQATSSQTQPASSKFNRRNSSVKRDDHTEQVITVEPSDSEDNPQKTTRAGLRKSSPLHQESNGVKSSSNDSKPSSTPIPEEPPKQELTSEQLEILNQIQSKKQELADIYSRHDSNVRLLFHLEKFVSLVSFDPEVAKQDNSSVFQDYRAAKYDLLEKLSGDSRSTRRRAHQQKDKFNALGSIEALTGSFPNHVPAAEISTSTAISTHKDKTPIPSSPAVTSTRSRRPTTNGKSLTTLESPRTTTIRGKTTASSTSTHTNGSANTKPKPVMKSEPKSQPSRPSPLHSKSTQPTRQQVGSKTLPKPQPLATRRISSRLRDKRKEEEIIDIIKVEEQDEEEDEDNQQVVDAADDSSEGYISDDFDEILFLDSTPESSDHEEEEEEDDDETTDNLSKHTVVPRIKFKFSLPEPTITHPGHIVTPRYGTLDNFLESFVSLDDDITKEDCEKYVAEQAEIRNRINELKESGMYEVYLEHMKEMGIGDLNGSTSAISTGTSSKPFATTLLSTLRKTYEDPVLQKSEPTFQDHLVSQAVFFAKLMSDERRSHTSKSKKMSGMVDAYFKRLSNAEEKERKLEEKRIRQLARRTALEVMKQWKIAEKVVQHRRAKMLEDEQRQAGKQQLNRILEKSAQLLEARVSSTTDTISAELNSKLAHDRNASIDELDDDVSYFGSEVEEDKDLNMDSDEEDEEEQEEEDNDDDEENSASDEEPNSQDLNNQPVTAGFNKKSVDFSTNNGKSDTNNDEIDLRNIPDSELTVEQLRKKYSSLPDITLNFDQSDEDEESMDEEDNGQSESESTSEKPVFNDEERVKEALKLSRGARDSDSDHSTVMDSEEDSDSEEYDSEEEPSGPGLAALLDPVHDEKEEADDKKTKSVEPSKDSIKDVDETSLNTTDTTSPIIQPHDTEREDEKSSPTAVATTTGNNSRSASAAPPADTIKTTVPFLLRGSLREYQHFGLDWLAGLYNNNTNGILADEMGLGKTIQTIALISYLACEKHIWGPHLIVVPTSVMLNWEMEFKRFAPGFKVLAYYGNPVQRKQKRQGWNKEDTWHVCITSYQLVIQDQNAFKRKRWHYMILDEAHNIKNFRSQRWQSLLNFNTQHRLLLTGTPLQNNLIELWSLLYFLMPSGRASEGMPEGFADLRNFQEWFSRPVERMVEGGEYVDEEAKQTISKLHQILRPYLLRRLKADVEKQMPGKYEHVVYCKLSKRQRFLYDDFMSRAQTRETLASGNFLSIINCLMQLRKVCNHPDLFEVRPIVTSLAVNRSVSADFEIKDFLVRKRLVDQVSETSMNQVNLDFLNLKFTQNDFSVSTGESISTHKWGDSRRPLIQEILSDQQTEVLKLKTDAPRDLSSINGHMQYINLLEKQDELIKLESSIYQSHYKSERTPMYGTDLINKLSTMVSKPAPARGYDWNHSDVVSSMKLSYQEREAAISEVIDRYAFVTPKVVCLDLPRQVLGPQISELLSAMPAPRPVKALDEMAQIENAYTENNQLEPSPRSLRMTSDLQKIQSQSLFHRSLVKLSIAFPDKTLLQYDCGKLQRLATLLHDLTANGHRALIFTQMTRVLDILEQFLNLHGYRYLRLDGATKIEQRQLLTERFNHDPRIPIFILSTRSGGLGINLTGADTVIFYDSDWNPSMDKQCQDRCHRIGQTRDVHIYRLVSEYTIESNILRKAQQKQMLDNVVIQEGEFTTDYFNKLSVKDMLGDDSLGGHADEAVFQSSRNLENVLASAEDDEDAKAARMAMKEVTNLDAEDFEDTQRPGKSSNGVGTPMSDSSERPGPTLSSNALKSPSASLEFDQVLGPNGRKGDGVNDINDINERDSQPLEVENEQEEEEERDNDEGINSIDDYMIRFIENGYYWD